MNGSKGNLVGTGIGPDQKFILRSRKVLAVLVMLAPAFGLSLDGVEALQGLGDKVVGVMAAALVLWSTVRADGAKLTLSPNWGMILERLSKVGLVVALLITFGCAATVTKTDSVTSVSWVWGQAKVVGSDQCPEGMGCESVTVAGGAASEGFLAAVMSPIGTILKGILAGL